MGCSLGGRYESDTTERLHFHALEKKLATHSSVLAWRIPGTGSLVGCCLWGRTESDTILQFFSSSSRQGGKKSTFKQRPELSCFVYLAFMPAWELTATDGIGLTGPLAHEGQGNVPSSAFSWVQRILGLGGVEEGGRALPLAATTPCGRRKFVLFGLRVETSSLSCQGHQGAEAAGSPRSDAVPRSSQPSNGEGSLVLGWQLASIVTVLCP